MQTKERLRKAREQGITLKMIALATDINLNTIYAYSCGKINLCKEKEEKINKVLDILGCGSQC